jgi:SAM-dependent methyltransferase
MGTNLIVAERLYELYSGGHLNGLRSVLELGPQGLGVSHNHQDAYKRFARARFGDCEKVRQFEKNAYDENGSLRPMAQKDFYRLFDIVEYKSVDLLDDNADYIANLNEPFDLDRHFDMVCDFGTSEHVFNIGQTFASAYNLLRPGGIAFYQLPVMGLIHHGLYNIHTDLYYSLAAAGYYEIVKMDFFHNLPSIVFSKKIETALKIPSGHDIRNGDAPRMTLRFYLSDIWQALRGQQRTAAIVIVALRKISDKPFIFPQQHNKTWGF